MNIEFEKLGLCFENLWHFFAQKNRSILCCQLAL